MRTRQRLAYAAVAASLVVLVTAAVLVRNQKHVAPILDMAASAPLLLACAAVWAFTWSKMRRLGPSLEEAIASVNRQFAVFVLAFVPFCILDVLSLTTHLGDSLVFLLVGLSIRVIAFGTPILYMSLVHRATVQKHDQYLRAKDEEARQSMRRSERATVADITTDTSGDYSADDAALIQSRDEDTQSSQEAAADYESVSLAATMQGYQLAVARETTTDATIGGSALVPGTGRLSQLL